MYKLYKRGYILICCLFLSSGVYAQVVSVTNPGFTTPALAATYTSLANAITALNTITAISGAVTITLNAGNPQTAPIGGYVINFTASTTNAKNVTIKGSNNIITANAALVSGSLTDAIFKIVGVDFMTIQDFTMQENAANSTSAVATNNMTEWGVALLYTTATKGSQNNTILNNTISLNKSYSNTFGIYSNTRHTATVVNITADITSTAGANSSNKIYGNAISNVNMGIAFIGSGSAAFMDLGNDIGGASATTANSITNWGGIAAASTYISNSGSCYGVFVNNQKNENVSFNTITSATVSGTSVAIRGVFKDYGTVPTGTFTSTISDNVIRINHNFSSGVLDGIRSQGISSPLSTATININNNRFQTISVLAASSSTSIVGIANTSQCGVLNINANIFRGNNSTATTGGFTGISNTGAVQTTLNINNNQLGDALGNAISFSAATNAAIIGITCPTIAAGAALSISGNNFKGFVQSVAGSGAHTYITYTHAASGATIDNINSNTFTNLVANTSADVNFILRSGTMAVLAGATDNCNNNIIITAFSKPVAGGIVTIYNSSSGSLSGNTMVQTGNDFSNITLTGATAMNGWSITEGGVSGPIKTISNNIFSNWACGTSAFTVLATNFGDNNTIVSGNTISTISAAAAITGISLGSSNKGTLQTCSGNTVADLSSTGGSVIGITGGATTVTTFNINNNIISGLSSTSAGSAVIGMRMLTASTANIFKNKIYDLNAGNATCTVSGMDVFGTAAGTYNINNNLVGDLRADLTNSTIAIRGINFSAANAGTAYNVFYNTVYLNALAGGTNFGSAALSVTVSATAANGALSLRNNILVNTSLAKGTGLTVAYRRSGTALNNFANSSNNNIFYSGIPSATNLIFNDGTNSDQALTDYKARVIPRDAASFTELPPFLSTAGSSANFLHLDPAATTQAESGAVNIATYTTDFDGDIRQGNAGYTGTGTAPDIGADELNLTADAVVVVTNYNLTSPNLAPTYTSLANAITALNAITAIGTGTVTITLKPGNGQTAPAGGYSINFTATTTATSNIIITGNNNTIRASGSLVAGSLTDAIFKIIGCDFVTIDNFTMKENVANTITDPATNNMTEWGVALLYASTSNGAQNNIIQNNTISLVVGYRNTFGIYSNTRHNATDIGTDVPIINGTTAPNHGNKIYANTISFVNQSIAFIGSDNVDFMDIGNDIGGSSLTTGNTITSFGNLFAESDFIGNGTFRYAICMRNQKDNNVSYNSITGGTALSLNSVIEGINVDFNTAPTGSFSSNITNNIIQISNFQTGIGGRASTGIFTSGITSLSTATLNITANRIKITGRNDITCISNNSSAAIVNINNNILRDNSISIETDRQFRGISSSATCQTALNINNNMLGDALGNAVNISSATTGSVTGISSGANSSAAIRSISGNNFQGFVQTVTGSNSITYINYIHTANTNSTDNINNNTFTNLVANTSGTVTFINRGNSIALNAGHTDNCSFNSIITGFSKPVAGGAVSLYNAGLGSLAAGNTMLQTGNNFSNITLTGATVMNGWNNQGGGATAITKLINNNIFTNWTGGSADVYVILTDKAGDNTSVSGNIISGINTSGRIEAISYGASITGTQTCSNNTISGLSSTGGFIYGITGDQGNTVATFNVNNNTLNGFSLVASSNQEITGISLPISGSVNLINNKIADFSIFNNTVGLGTIYGILEVNSTTVGTLNIINNIIGDFHASISNSNFAISGISFVGGLANSNRANIYYNTIYLNATSTGTNFGTSGIELQSSGVFSECQAALRNNIIVNTSIANGLGKTVAYRRTGVPNLINYNISSNNNIFYADIPSPKNLIFSDGTNNDQTLAAYKTRVGPTRDALSLSELPVFLSTSGADATFLHLDDAVNCNLLAKGDNSTILIADDYDGNTRSTVSPFITEIGADEVTQKITWTGALGTDWNTPGNWSPTIVPATSGVSVTIPVTAIQPTIAALQSFQVGNLTISPGMVLTNLGTLKIAGSVTATAGINSSAGKIEMTSACLAQTISGAAFINRKLKDLTLNNTFSTNPVVSLGATLNDTLKLTGLLSFGNVNNKTFQTNDNLTLASTVAGTATVADMTNNAVNSGNQVSGNVIVERFINTGTGGGEHAKSWQFLATPVTGQTIRQAWQENGTTPAGFGTVITGTGTGFDITTTIPSMKFYNEAAANFTAVTNTNNSLMNSLGYFLFVRGDRTVTTSGGTPNNTTLRSKGTLFQPVNPPSSVPVTANKFQTFGNPYASRIEFSKVLLNSLSILDVFYVWDPKLVGNFGFGGYQTISGVTGYIPTVGVPPVGNPATVYYPAGVPAPFIESGQAVFVKGNATGGNINFNETVKATGSRLVNRHSTGNNDIANRGFIFATLFTNSGNIADGNIVAFEDGLGNELNGLDAVKIMNSGENFGIKRLDSVLAVEARNRVMRKDTVFYYLQNLKKLPYQFCFTPVNMHNGEHAYLVDRFTNSNTEVSMTDSSFINFSITDDINSQAAGRFMLVFKKGKKDSDKTISLYALQDQGRSILINWKADDETDISKYELERSGDGKHFTVIGNEIATGKYSGIEVYSYMDEQPLGNDVFYRIKAISPCGQVQYSAVAKVTLAKTVSVIAVSPNPVVDKKINLRFTGQPAGRYDVELINNLGQAVYTNSFYIDGANVLKTMQLFTYLSPGSYRLCVTSEAGSRLVETVVVR